MQQIADSLESAGFGVFLPQRDGLEMARIVSALVDEGMNNRQANQLLAKAIFHIDTYQVAKCDGLVLNLNGRVPDEGAMVEAGIAWALKRPVVIYKNDARSALLGQDNPLVLGLASFKTIREIGELPTAFSLAFAKNLGNADDWLMLADQVVRNLDRGARLQRIFTQRRVNRANAERLAKVLEEA